MLSRKELESSGEGEPTQRREKKRSWRGLSLGEKEVIETSSLSKRETGGGPPSKKGLKKRGGPTRTKLQRITILNGVGGTRGQGEGTRDLTAAYIGKEV